MATTDADTSVVGTWQAPGYRGQSPCLPALFVKLFAGFLLGRLPSRIPLLEASNATAGVENLLLARIERMAV
jgi:hypothetical protein